MHENHELCSLVSFKSLALVYFLSWTQLWREMDPEEYEQIFGYLNDKKYPNDIKESEKKKNKKDVI